MPFFVFECEQHGSFEDLLDKAPRFAPCPECESHSPRNRGREIAQVRVPGGRLRSDCYKDEKRCATNGDLGWLRGYQRRGLSPREEVREAERILKSKRPNLVRTTRL